MVELRKRKATPAEPTASPPSKKSGSSNSEVKALVPEKKAVIANSASSDVKITVGNTIPLNHFGGEVETQEGEKITLEKLLIDSKNGIVIFTYPRASTPGCKVFPYSCYDSL